MLNTHQLQLLYGCTVVTQTVGVMIAERVIVLHLQRESLAVTATKNDDNYLITWKAAATICALGHFYFGVCELIQLHGGLCYSIWPAKVNSSHILGMQLNDTDQGHN